MARGRNSSETDVMSIQRITLSTYESIKTELEEVDRQLDTLHTRRDHLEELGRALLEVNIRVGQLEPSSQVDAEHAPARKAIATPTPTPAPKPKPQPTAARATPAKATKGNGKPAPKDNGKAPGPAINVPVQSPARSTRGKAQVSPAAARTGRGPGKLERDVREIMAGSGAMRARDIISALVEQLNYKDNESTRTYVYSSLGKWSEMDWLSRVSRGTYEMMD